MKKRSLFFCMFILLTITLPAQLKSPSDFLGYKIGEKYTPHWKIVNYFNAVALEARSTVKLQNYGETNEGRPLMLAFISSPENLRNLELIRKNNLASAGLSSAGFIANENNPAIVWLSYNVHGNETSSSEAAMMTLFALADPSNAKTKEWLKNTVVIIDPCINPDGRERYINWFNSVRNKNANPKLESREHREPWPGGRSNHYNFDLNRDWAWQTQVESQQRLKVYNQWMPQIHVDFHEQGVNQPYYFAPAAQPFHDVITGWQRDFQTSIGKNHAKYFDANNWLYFTKEIFDLFYPSYGDTYPTFNGAIGMTYEQGGGPAGGIAVLNDEGDTLTLLDRATHHFTTSLSTIEISSLNAGKLTSEFKKYFSEAINKGIGEYKSYVIKNIPENKERIVSLLELLNKNEIKYSTTKQSIAKGYNYFTGKEESITIGSDDILINSQQPRSALLNVLFEPRSRLVDSATYDITAWSLPYVYGIQAYAFKQPILSAGTDFSFAKVNNEISINYGAIIPWKGMQSAKVTAQLLKEGIRLRFADNPFEIDGKKYDRGSIIILKIGNEKFGNTLWKTVAKHCTANEVQLMAVSSGFVDKGYDFGSGKVHPMKAPRIACLTGETVGSLEAGEVWHFFEQVIDYPVSMINANDFGRLKLDNYDVLILPDGNYRLLSDKTTTDQLKDWISKGGRLIAMENAVSLLAKLDWAIKVKKDDEKKPELYEELKKFDDRDRDAIRDLTAGSIYKTDIDNTHPLAFGYPEFYYTLKRDNKIYEFIKEQGWNVGVIKKENQVAGFVGSKLREKLKDGMLFGVQNIGAGTITYLTDDLLFRSFWENGKLMFTNAVFLVGQ